MSEEQESSDRRVPADLSEWEIRGGNVAESVPHGEVIKVLRSSLERLARQRSWASVHVGSNNYFAWIRERPRVRVSPDVYLVDDPPKKSPSMWKTWLPGHSPPRWAVEIVSANWQKDYDQDPVKYEQLGTRELVLFDPDAALGNTRISSRLALTVFRRTKKGTLAVAYQGTGPWFSEELGIWLFPKLKGYELCLRLSEDKEGTKIILTADEAEEAERAAKEAERAAKEAERAAKEAERAARLAAEECLAKAEARIAELERDLADKKRN